ncbi:hypothetical protein LAZ67_16002325 [Cordylochernes scorpioides]|uniref:Transposase n=1 Tax=Cordylochernes scorpioides TaxID=51811 RepID=A0ABY6LBW3_9ARAC|nr:hypothetical protein LAZ67_16002325 [Cordylochernes scorpioides]
MHPDHDNGQLRCLVRVDVLFWIDVCHIEGCKDGRATVYVVRMPQHAKLFPKPAKGKISQGRKNGGDVDRSRGLEPLECIVSGIWTNDDEAPGRPTTARTDENVDRVLEVLRTDRRLSIQQIADTLHMSTFVVHGIVTEDLQMQLLDLIQNEPGFLNSVVTGDESWMFEYDQESKRQSCAWHKKSSPRPKKARMSKSRFKTMIIVFFDIRGIVHCEFVPQGQTVNSAFYLEVLRRLKRRIARVRTDIKDTVKLYHDNATSHTAFIITNFLARSNTPVIPHPPYRLDLAPCDFFLFPRLKRELKGKHWETVENIQHHVTTFLRSIPVEEFQGAFQAWQTCLRNPTHSPYSPDIAPSNYFLFLSMQHGLADQHFSDYAEVKKRIDEWIAAKEPAFSSDGIRQLPERWEKVVASDGQYFEH